MDLISFLYGGVAGAAAAAAAWAVLRAARRPTPREEPPDANAPLIRPWPDPTTSDRREEHGPRTWAPPGRDDVRLSERVLLQLAREGRLDPDAPARRGRTQAGLTEALGSNQSSVSKVLRRLVAAGVVGEERRHVTGVPQRVKVYDLTRRGELLARDIAARRSVSLLPPRPESEPELSAIRLEP